MPATCWKSGNAVGQRLNEKMRLSSFCVSCRSTS